MAVWTCLQCREISKQNYIEKCPRCGSKSLSVQGYVYDMDNPDTSKARKDYHREYDRKRRAKKEAE